MTLEKASTRLRMARFAAHLLRHWSGASDTVPDFIERQVRKNHNRVFVRFEGRERTYGEYNAAANRIAHWAIGQRVQPGEPVALLMENRPEFLETWSGIAKAGGVATLINTNLSGRALEHVLEAGKARRFIIGSECLEKLDTLSPTLLERLDLWALEDPADSRNGSKQTSSGDSGAGSTRPLSAGSRAGLTRPLSAGSRADSRQAPTADSNAAPLPTRVASLDQAIASMPSDNPPRSVRNSVKAGHDLFYIYTSGTTGLPKAARFSHARFFGGAIHSFVSGFGPGDTLYCPLPLYHTTGGVLAVCGALTAGGTLALRRKFSASRFWEDVVSNEANAFVYIGELCRYLLSQPPSPLERAHRVRFMVGNGLRPDIWDEFQRRFAIPHIVEFYGATEANVSTMNLNDVSGSVGKMFPGTRSGARLVRFDVDRETHIRDARGFCINCKPGEVGELIGSISDGLTAKGRFEGYTSKKSSENKILRDVFKKGDRWFRTGDLLYFDADDNFFFVDRIGDTFRCKGENVATQEVAEALSRYPGVNMAAVYGVEVPGMDGRIGMAALAGDLKAGDPPGLSGDCVSSPLDGKALYDFVREALPAYARPAFIRLPRTLEETSTFKIRKLHLKQQGYDLDLVEDPLYLCDKQAQRYVPLTREKLETIKRGIWRF